MEQDEGTQFEEAVRNGVWASESEATAMTGLTERELLISPWVGHHTDVKGRHWYRVSQLHHLIKLLLWSF